MSKQTVSAKKAQKAVNLEAVKTAKANIKAAKETLAAQKQSTKQEAKIQLKSTAILLKQQKADLINTKKIDVLSANGVTQIDRAVGKEDTTAANQSGNTQVAIEKAVTKVEKATTNAQMAGLQAAAVAQAAAASAIDPAASTSILSGSVAGIPTMYLMLAVGGVALFIFMRKKKAA
jgi:hypothetical protein